MVDLSIDIVRYRLSVFFSGINRSILTMRALIIKLARSINIINFFNVEDSI